MRAAMIFLLGSSMLAGCNASTGETIPSKSRAEAVSKTPAEIEIQEDVGFTITEKVRVSGDLRFDYAEALRLLNGGEREAGLALLETISERAPQLTAPLIDLGIATHENGDLDRAEDYLDRALELQPEQPVVHNELGIIYRKTGRFSEARKSYENALAIYPGFHFARRNLAVLCDLYLDDRECAMNNYRAYMETVSEDPQATIWIADLEMRLNQQGAVQ